MSSLRLLPQRATFRYTRALSTAAGDAAGGDAATTAKRAVPIADSFGDISISNFSVKGKGDMPFNLKKIANSGKSSMSARLAKNRVESTQQETTTSPNAAVATASSTPNSANNMPKPRQAQQKKDSLADAAAALTAAEGAAPTATTATTPDAYDRILQQSLSLMQERRDHRARADAAAAEAKAKRREESRKVLAAAKSEAEDAAASAREARRNDQRQRRDSNNNARDRSAASGGGVRTDRTHQQQQDGRRAERRPRAPRTLAPHRKAMQEQKMLSEVGNKDDVDSSALSSEQLYALAMSEEAQTREATDHLQVPQTDFTRVFSRRSRARRAQERSMAAVTTQERKAKRAVAVAKKGSKRVTPPSKLLEKAGGVYERFAPSSVLTKAGQEVGPLPYAQLALLKVQNATPKQRSAALGIISKHVAAAAQISGRA